MILFKYEENNKEIVITYSVLYRLICILFWPSIVLTYIFRLKYGMLNNLTIITLVCSTLLFLIMCSAGFYKLSKGDRKRYPKIREGSILNFKKPLKIRFIKN